jgi:hypothetical protein
LIYFNLNPFFYPFILIGIGFENESLLNYHLHLTSTKFGLLSGGDINLFSGNRSSFGASGGSVSMIAGSGINKQGGSGGYV